MAHTLEESRFQKLKILLIDDDEEDYFVTRQILKKTKTIKSIMEWTNNYEEALKLCHSNAYDVILIDYKMGAHTGIEFISQAKDELCNTPFILLTGVQDERLGIQAIRKGAEDYLVKGELTPELLERSILYSIERSNIRKKEQELREKNIIARSERHFRSLIENSTEGIALLNKLGRISYVSPSVRMILGYTPEEIKQTKITSLIHEHDLQKHTEAVNDLTSRKISHISLDVRAKHRNGSWRWIKLSVSDRLSDPHVSAYVINFHDVTSRVRLDQLKDEFLSIASHELKTPLTTVKGYIQLLEKYFKEKDDPKALKYIQQSDIYIDKLNQLISDLLDISRIQSGRLILELSPIKLKPRISKTCDALQHLSSLHTLQFESECNPEVVADENRVEQVLTNLISNAVKYSPEESQIHIHLTCTDYEAVVSVRDHGIGISPEDQQKLFKRFFRTESAVTKFSGLGIGLYISHEIVTRHKGRMWVESKEHQGSTFYFTLPLHK